MSDVICLCDSSDDDDDAARPLAVTARVPLDAAGVIELLDSDDENRSHHARQEGTVTFLGHSIVTRAPSSFPVISQEDNSPSTTPTARTQARSNLQRLNKAVVVSAQRATSQLTRGEDSDSSDDPILEFRSGFKTAKTPAKPSNSLRTPNLPNSAVHGAITYQRNGPASSAHIPASAGRPSRQYSESNNSNGNSTPSIRIRNPYAKKQQSKATAKQQANETSSRRSKSAVTKAMPASVHAPTLVNSGRSHTTPVAISNPYAKKRPTPAPATISFRTPTTEASTQIFGCAETSPLVYPCLLSKSKLHSDKRAQMVLALWKYSRSLNSNSHDRAKLDQTVTKLVRLALSKHPIRSVEEYLGRHFKLGGAGTSSGATMKKTLMESLDRGDFGRIQTPVDACRDGRYYSIAEACLVSFLTWLDAKFREKSLNFRDPSNPKLCSALAEKDMWMPLVDLIPEIDSRLQYACPHSLGTEKHSDRGATILTEPSTRSAEYKQIEKLLVPTKEEDVPYLKQHKRKGKVLFEMTTLGFETARRIRSRQYPAPVGPYRSSNITTADSRYHNLCLAVDFREGGGAGNVLHIMCNKLDMTGLPYFVGNLDIGDYCFFASNRLCPILIERKSIEDVALSLHDGRWVSQKKRMYRGQYVFGYDCCRLVFIIEGKEEKQQMTGGYIGNRKFNVTRERLDDEINKLNSEGFEVWRTSSPENSMFRLARWARVIAQEVQSNKLHLKYTYEQFKDAVGQIPEDTDFSRLARDAMATRLETPVRSSADLESPLSTADREPGNEMPVLMPSMSANAKLRMAESKLSGKKRKLYKNSKEISKRDSSEYADLSVSELKKQCEEKGLPKSGTKVQIIKRLNGPLPPRLWLKRKQEGQYVPQSYDCGATALLVALYLTERESSSVGLGVTQEDLYMKAESLDITKHPFSGGTTQTGPYYYDGWSSMSKLLKGDPPLVTMKKQRYKLTRCCDTAGFSIAEAMHLWCHEHQNCKCQSL